MSERTTKYRKKKDRTLRKEPPVDVNELELLAWLPI